MNKNKDVDQMLEEFLNNNHVEDNDFSKNVLSSLPQQPRLLWITDLYPLMGIVLGLLAAWKLDVVHPQMVMGWLAKLNVLLDFNMTAISATVSVSFVVGMIALIAFFISEKIKDF